MIDTSRHYLSVDTILNTIDALSYSKMNVLHWHLVDAQSFPVEIENFELLSEKGAYCPECIYTSANITYIVEYARQRGVRVVPEMDVPGHAASWGKGYPEILSSCPPGFTANINDFPLNPINNQTYEVINGTVTALAPLFPDEYYHIGGDEVVYTCWEMDPEIMAYMAKHNMTSVDLEQYFENRIEPMIKGQNKSIVIWEDLYNSGVEIPMDYLVEVWMDQFTLQQIAANGYKTIMAAGWYLANSQPDPPSIPSLWYDTWMDFYKNDPLNNSTLTPEQEQNILGGEMASWSEQVNDQNAIERIWPRGAAVAERLWSNRNVKDTNSAMPRLMYYVCRAFTQRGVQSGPIGPDYCEIPPQYKKRTSIRKI